MEDRTDVCHGSTPILLSVLRSALVTGGAWHELPVFLIIAINMAIT